MKLNSFLTCLGYFGISTGASDSLEGIYAFNSGTTGIIYNQLSSTGGHFSGALLSAAAIPLINVSRRPFYNSTFSGVNSFRVGYKHTGNFSVLLDIESTGCSKRGTGFWQKDEIIFSTVENPTNYASGFSISINNANRLVFKSYQESFTLDKELNLHDFVFVSLAENKYVNFGIFDFSETKFYNQSVTSENVLDTPNIYLGGFLNNTDTTNYSNFSGKMNQMILFNDTITDNDIAVCIDCSFTTGYIKTTGVFYTSGLQITGLQFSGIQNLYQTGVVETTGSILIDNGGVLNISVPSGLTGFVQTGEMALPLYGLVPISGFRDVYNFNYDLGYISSFSSYNIQFDFSATSGDVIEIYTYPRPNINIGKDVINFNYPAETGFVQLISNGLIETSGTDYVLDRGEFSGYNVEDILRYDVLDTGTIIVPYSGYWQTSKISLSGGAFFPPAPQYSENAGVIIVDSIEGICNSNIHYPRFGYDIYLNGQKLVSGLQYNIGAGTGASFLLDETGGFLLDETGGFVFGEADVSQFTIYLSGLTLPSFMATSLYPPGGGLPTGVTDIDDSEMSFVAQYNDFARTLYTLTGTSGNFAGLSGFSEQIWVNGVRQAKGVDYLKYNICAFNTGALNLPVFDTFIYDSNTDELGILGFQFP